MHSERDARGERVIKRENERKRERREEGRKTEKENVLVLEKIKMKKMIIIIINTNMNTMNMTKIILTKNNVRGHAMIARNIINQKIIAINMTMKVTLRIDWKITINILNHFITTMKLVSGVRNIAIDLKRN